MRYITRYILQACIVNEDGATWHDIALATDDNGFLSLRKLKKRLDKLNKATRIVNVIVDVEE